MKKIKRKHLLQGLKKILSKYYRKFSKKERLIISSAIEELSKSKGKWLNKTGKFLTRAALILTNMF